MPDTCADLCKLLWLALVEEYQGTRCYVEEVSGFAGVGQPGSAMFTFGRGFGNIEGILTALKIPFVMVRPQTWQKALNIPKTGTQRAPNGSSPEDKKRIRAANAVLKREHKARMKELAQRLYPTLTVTLTNADALLLLEYARKQENGAAAEMAKAQPSPVPAMP